MTSPIDSVERVLDALRDVDAGAVALGSDDEVLGLLVAVEEAGRLIDALRVSTAVEVEKRSDRALGEDGLAARHGFRSGGLLVEQLTGVSASTARMRIRVGQLTQDRVSVTGGALPPLFPQVGAALAAGALCVDAADAITRELQKASPRADVAQLVAAEEHLVGQATGVDAGVPLPADLVAGQARLWRDALDPDGIEPRADEAFEARGLWVSRTSRNGRHTVGGALTDDVAAQWFAIMDAMSSAKSGPKFLPEPGASGCLCPQCTDGTGPDGAHPCRTAPTCAPGDDADDADVRDTRSWEQRGHDGDGERVRPAGRPPARQCAR